VRIYAATYSGTGETGTIHDLCQMSST
jgi:hypothetical protein